MTTLEQRSDLFRMPALGADMTEGRVVEWYVGPGARAERGDLVAVVETDKADIEIEVFEPCVFDQLLVQLGEAVAVGEPIARITVDGPPRPSTSSVGDPAEPVVAVTPTLTTAPARPPDATTSRSRMTPRARRLARERGVDVDDLPREGAITGDTILRLGVGGDRPERDRSSNLRDAVARLMERSWAEIPHYHVTSTIDLTDAMRRLDETNSSRSAHDRLVPAAILYAAVARAAADTPQVNGWWQGHSFVPSESVDLGVVLSLRTGGVVVPTIPAADRLDSEEMMAVLRDLVERARRGRLRERDIRPASLSTTNMGERGAGAVLGIIHPPQVALVGLGSPQLRPGVIGGDVVPRLLVEASVAGDHRAHDGLVAARLLKRIAHHLEDMP